MCLACNGFLISFNVLVAFAFASTCVALFAPAWVIDNSENDDRMDLGVVLDYVYNKTTDKYDFEERGLIDADESWNQAAAGSYAFAILLYCFIFITSAVVWTGGAKHHEPWVQLGTMVLAVLTFGLILLPMGILMTVWYPEVRENKDKTFGFSMYAGAIAIGLLFIALVIEMILLMAESAAEGRYRSRKDRRDKRKDDRKDRRRSRRSRH